MCANYSHNFCNYKYGNGNSLHGWSRKVYLKYVVSIGLRLSLPAFVTTEHAKIGLENTSSLNARYGMGHTYTKKILCCLSEIKIKLGICIFICYSWPPYP